MKKSILNIGKALNRAEQKQINGGHHVCLPRYTQENCDEYCGSLDDIMVGSWNGISTAQAGIAAAEAYSEHCGGPHSH